MDSDGDIDTCFPVDGTGAGPAPEIPEGAIQEDDMSKAIIAYKNRIAWLEARETNYMDKITCQYDEIVKLKQDALETKRSLQVESIKATLKTIQGIQTSTKRIQAAPHEMDAAHIRVKKYGLKWSKITVPPREINPNAVDIKIIHWDQVEKARVEKHPEDKPQVPNSWYTKSYELKAGSAKGTQTYDENAREEPRKSRGEHYPRARGHRGGRGRGYRGNQTNY